MQKEKVIIIGSGPAGLTAALYTARANLNPLLIVGPQFGGQVALTHEIENYPGFPGGSGSDLVETMKAQAEKFGTRMEWDVVLGVDFASGSPFRVRTGNNEFLAEALIATSGALPRMLNVPGESVLTGRGVSYCGTCDGYFFKNKTIVVVGGGDSAIKEALFLTKFVSHIDIIHRRDTLRAEAALQERAFTNEKINFIWNTVVDEIKGDAKVEAVVLRDLKTGQTREHPTEGAFIFIGHEPNNELFKGVLSMDEHGYVITDKLMQTNIPGVFAAGEIQDPVWKQVATSVGQGCAAAIAAEEWLAAREKTDIAKVIASPGA
jgi:thioredoxin reductase (NADPH)